MKKYSNMNYSAWNQRKKKSSMLFPTGDKLPPISWVGIYWAFLKYIPVLVDVLVVHTGVSYLHIPYYNGENLYFLD